MKRLSLGIMALACLCIFSQSGCKKAEAPPAEEKRETLLIGLIPEQNIFKQLDRYEPLIEYLSRKSRINIKLIVLTRYGSIIDNFIQAGLDGAIFGSFTYVLAHARLGVEAIVRPEDEEGKSTYYGLILVRKDSGIKNVTQMKGRRFAFVDKGTYAGYLFPLRYFKGHGIADYENYLREVYYTGTHEDAIHDVLHGKADITSAKDTVYERMVLDDSKISDELAILARSPEVPENCLALREGISEATKNRLKDILLTMHFDPEGRKILKKFGANKFIETKDLDYQVVYNYAKEINLDLTNYNYK
ncbi:MAG: hypothetical protein A2505_08670 [Deltaproteobacteria bacterium RIFOXYD12_FULL_55_16]|nr:MAG: hypothetical protein A2505_08670 [Deltaproteobacteria bacterium RIFOXYD12_FULL_55_16]